MSLLTDSEIRTLISSKTLLHNTAADSIQAASYDLRAGTFYISHQELKGNGQRSSVIVKPGEMITIHTVEEFDLPNDIGAYVFPMNRLSSKGFLVINPGHIDPGFKGPVTVVALNINKNPITISYEQPIFTATFHSLTKQSEKPYSSNYAIRDQASRIKKEQEMQQLVNGSSIGSISDVVDFGGKYVSETRANEIFRSHWMTTSIFALTIISTILAGISIYSSFAGIAKDSTELQITKLKMEQIQPIQDRLKELEKDASKEKTSSNTRLR